MSDAAAGREHGESGRRYWIPAVIAALRHVPRRPRHVDDERRRPVYRRDLHDGPARLQSAIAVYSMVMAARIIP